MKTLSNFEFVQIMKCLLVLYKKETAYIMCTIPFVIPAVQALVGTGIINEFNKVSFY